MADSRRADLHSRPMASSIPGLNTSRRTWNDNGIQFTVETTSFSTPGLSFGASGAGAGNQPRNIFASTNNAQPRAGGVLGAAFNLLGNVLTAQPQASTRGNARRRSNQPYVEDDTAYSDDEDDEDEEFLDEGRNRRPGGFISKVAERLAANSQQARRVPRNREQSPVRRAPRRSQTDGWSQPYRTEERKPSWTGNRRAQAEEFAEEDDSEEDDYDYENFDRSRDQHRDRSSVTDDADIIDALANAANHHQRELKKCKRQLEQASRQPNVNATVLQNLVNEIKSHEKAYLAAEKNLREAQAGTRGGKSRRHTPHQARPSQRRRSTMSAEEFFGGSSMPHGFESFFRTSRTPHSNVVDSDDFFASSGSSPFAGFDRIFNDDFFFAMPRNTFAGQSTNRSPFSTGNSGPRFRQAPSFTSFSTPPPKKPPPNILKPEEAKALFKLYNERWSALAPVDPNIPFPCRGMQPNTLSTRDTIWAPLVSSPVSTWSEETIMQANAQAFFLGVVGLTPQYTEAPGTGRIVMGYDKARASQEQSDALVNVLKKEKARWHSDRLGRRNGGVTAGPNETLQRDERARAVFHAVCELMEVAQ